MQIGPTEQRRRELKDVMLDVQKALVDTSVPSKMKRSAETPHYYSAGGSWEGKGKVRSFTLVRRMSTRIRARYPVTLHRIPGAVGHESTDAEGRHRAARFCCWSTFAR